MIKTIIRYWFVIIFLSSCNGDRSNEEIRIRSLIKSNDVNKIVEGYYLIGEKRQVSYIPDLFNSPDDNRISNQLNFKGISVYQSKMIAMKKISGLNPPRKIDYQSDSLVIAFYYKWALKNNYVKKR